MRLLSDLEDLAYAKVQFQLSFCPFFSSYSSGKFGEDKAVI